MISFAFRASKQVLALLAVVCLSLTSAHAGVIFEDNFDADIGGVPATSLINWNINLPSVDVVGGASFGHLCNGATAGNCLDMDGTPAGNGQITTKVGLNLAAGGYKFSFDFGNNTHNNNSLAWNIGTLASGIIYTGSAQNNTYTNSANYFSLASAASGVYITFTGGGTPSLGGTVLDNVRLETAAVPEPSMLALLGVGMFGLLGMKRRKRTSRLA